MYEKVTFLVRNAFAPGVAEDEARRNAEGSRFSEMIRTLVAADVAFSQIDGEPWRIRRSAVGVAALLSVEIVTEDIGRFAHAVKQCVAGPGLQDLSVNTFKGKDRAEAQRLLLGCVATAIRGLTTPGIAIRLSLKGRRLPVGQPQLHDRCSMAQIGRCAGAVPLLEFPFSWQEQPGGVA